MLSVVVVTFNSAKYIKSCLEAVFNQQQDFELIVVDNGSADETVRYIRENYPKVRLIINKDNLGACYARNQGIEMSSGNWILTLDCDVLLENGFMHKIMEFADKSEKSVGIIAPKILARDKRTLYSCGIHRSWLNRFDDIGKGLSDRQKFNLSKPVFGACCAAALYRRSMLEDIKDNYGYFDQRFFFLFEDVDLSWRAQKRRWICKYYPKVSCFHDGNSSATDKKTRQFLSFRNRQLAILKNQNPLVILLMLPLYLVYDLPRFLILAVKFKGNFPRFK